MNELPEYKNNIKERCEKRGWNAAALALHMYSVGYPVSKRTVHGWFQQEKQPGKKALSALCSVFACSASGILHFVEEST